jgi:4,4'-diaponeurosporenoate glycosyltransferase
MTGIIIEFVIVLIGLAVTPILFSHIPKLTRLNKKTQVYPSVSVIIPARNEERNLPLLLKDLSKQTQPPLEIIGVDDASEDGTAQIISSSGSRLISLKEKPEGWTGKTWACQKGAEAVRGDLLLFLDADVRLKEDGIQKLLQAFLEKGSAISVLPFHETQKFYEQFSMIFNLVQIAANGTALPAPANVGLFGPVILISHSDYEKAGGHEGVRSSIAEDMALGSQLKKAGIPYRVFVGDDEIAFRMYEGGFSNLLQGWVKNMATGAAKTPFLLFLMAFFWISSMTSVPLQIVKMGISENLSWLIIYSSLYCVWVLILSTLTRRIGRFPFWSSVFYPIFLLVFLGVFVVSLFKKIFGIKVTWKGRAVDTRKKT